MGSLDQAFETAEALLASKVWTGTNEEMRTVSTLADAYLAAAPAEQRTWARRRLRVAHVPTLLAFVRYLGDELGNARSEPRLRAGLVVLAMVCQTPEDERNLDLHCALLALSSGSADTQFNKLLAELAPRVADPGATWLRTRARASWDGLKRFWREQRIDGRVEYAAAPTDEVVRTARELLERRRRESGIR